MIPTSFSAQDFNKTQEPDDINKQCPQDTRNGGCKQKLRKSKGEESDQIIVKIC